MDPLCERTNPGPEPGHLLTGMHLEFAKFYEGSDPFWDFNVLLLSLLAVGVGTWLSLGTVAIG